MLIPSSILSGILLIFFFYLPFIQLANIYSGSTILGSGSKEEKNETATKEKAEKVHGNRQNAVRNMPVAALSLYPTCYIARLMRSSMLDVIGQDYMRTARAKGVSEFKSVFKHALRNAILPVVTYLGPLLASLMTGSFIIEKIFTIPGLGHEFVSAIPSRDYPLIMGTTIFLACFIIMMNVIVDIAYAFIDPRIKLK